MILEAMYCILVLKCGFTGLTFGYFIGEKFSFRRSVTVMFSVLYALTRTLTCFFLIALLPAAFKMVSIYAPTKLTGTGWPQWVLYDSYVVGSIAMVLGYLRITPGKVKALWNNTVEKTEFEKINEGEANG